MIIDIPRVGAINTADIRRVTPIESVYYSGETAPDSALFWIQTAPGVAGNAESRLKVATHWFMPPMGGGGGLVAFKPTGLTKEQVEKIRESVLKAWSYREGLQTVTP
jgi:hypothetical protein